MKGDQEPLPRRAPSTQAAMSETSRQSLSLFSKIIYWNALAFNKIQCTKGILPHGQGIQDEGWPLE